MNESQKIFAGLDWATTHHDLCLLSATGDVLGQKRFAHNAQGLLDLVQYILEATQSPASSCWLAIESTSGPVVDTLLEHGIGVFSLNPKQLDRFRDRFSPSGAKDDRRDARVLADSIRTDPRAFWEVKAKDPHVLELREWSRIHEQVQKERTRTRNRLSAQLQRYYPQILELDDDLARPWVLEILELVPNPEKAKRRRRASYKRILEAHSIRKLSPAEVTNILRQEPLVVANGVVEAASAHVRLLVEQLKLLNKQLEKARQQLDRLLAQFDEKTQQEGPTQQRDAEILQSLPGVGRIVAATLLGEAGESVKERDYQRLRILCGVAPVTKSSGKPRGRGSCQVKMRRACQRRLRQAAFYWGRTASNYEGRFGDQYKRLRENGQSAARAYRSVVDSLLRVAVGMLKSESTYRAGGIYKETKKTPC